MVNALRKLGLLVSIICIAKIVISQTLTIPNSETDLKVVALIDLHQHGQLLIRQQDNSNSLTLTLIDNQLNLKWEAEYPIEDGNGRKVANYLTFLHNSTTLFITNQTKKNYYGTIDIASGDITYEKPIEGTSELRKGDFYISREMLLQANTQDGITYIQKVRENDLVPVGEIWGPSLDKAIKETSAQIIKISNDTVYAYQSLPEPNHRKLNIILYKFRLNGTMIDSTHNKLVLSRHTFSFNSVMDLNCQFVFDYKNQVYMFGNLAPRLSDNFGQFPASDESRGLWWASFDKDMRTEYFNVYPFTSIFQKNEDIIFSQEKYWGVKADGDSGFFLNMNLIPGGVYTGNLTYYINRRGQLKMFSNTDNKENFMRYNVIFTRQYIKSSDVLVTNDEWNFFSTHQFGKMAYYPAIHSKYTKAIVERANKYPDDTQKSELAYTILYKDGFAIIAEYYFKRKKIVKFEIVR